MKIYEKFSLDLGIVVPLGRELMTLPPFLVEELIAKLKKKGYKVFEASAYFMGLPKSITISKNYARYSAMEHAKKMKNDFVNEASVLKMGELFV